MRKQTIVLAACAMILLIPVVSTLRAQSSRARAALGPVNMTWGQPGKFVGNQLYLLGGVHMASANYDLQAQSVTVTLQTGGKSIGGYGITKAVAVGDLAKNSQVTGRFSSIEMGRTYLINGDQAVYVPEPGRTGGGRIDFTGHVVITLKAPQALDGPAVTKVNQATVLVGVGADYPHIEFGPGTLTFTPLQ